MFTWANKMFAGKFSVGKFIEVVELIPGMNSRGELSILGLKIGEFIMHDSTSLDYITLDKDSLYYRAYYQTVTGLTLSKSN
jgi:hypothetical protein